LWECCPTFQALIRCWIKDKRCPLVMGDYLREQNMEAPALAADWAATYRDQRAFGWDWGVNCGPYPMNGGDRYMWHYDGRGKGNWSMDKSVHSDSLPDEAVSIDCKAYPTEEDALIAFLDAWRIKE
jgi:hypothetical protein